MQSGKEHVRQKRKPFEATTPASRMSIDEPKILSQTCLVDIRAGESLLPHMREVA